MKNESFNFHTLLGILLAIAIPISILATNILIITLLAYSIYIAISTKTYKIEYSLYLFLPVLFFIIELFSLLYSNNQQEGFFQLEKKLSFFIFPFIFSINTYKVKPFNISRILWFFSISILIVCIVSHCLALYSIFIHNLPINKFIDYEYSGHELFKHFKLHATYAGAYILLSISFLIFKYKDSPNRVRIYLALAITYLIFCALHTSSRIIFIILLILIAITLFQYIKISNILLRFIIVLLSVVFLFSALLYTLPYMHWKFLWVLDLWGSGSIPIDSLEYLRNERFYLWPLGFDLILENGILGVGTGDVVDVLNASYKEKGHTVWFENNYNLHSQYLQTTLGMGLPGLIVLFVLILFPIFRAIKVKDYVQLTFGITVGMICLTEVFFGLHQGIIFYCYFYCLLNANK